MFKEKIKRSEKQYLISKAIDQQLFIPHSSPRNNHWLKKFLVWTRIIPEWQNRV